jgi:parallel beta-helix repeat protein
VDVVSEEITEEIEPEEELVEELAEEPEEEVTGEKVIEEEIVEDQLAEVGSPLAPEEETSKWCKYKGSPPSRFRVLINEVAWAGTVDSGDDEWLELKNIWGIPVNLEGWQLLDKDGDIKIIFGEDETIPADGFYLLEEMGGAIDDSNEALYLFDAECNLEDEVQAFPTWPGGDKFSKRPMERFDIWSWYTSSAGSGTAGEENTPPPAALTHPAPEPVSETPSYPKLLINEIHIESKDNVKDDFVELYNPNDKDVDLTDWYLQRKTKSGADFSTYAPAKLFNGKQIKAKGYFLIANASSTFATSADVLTTYPLSRNNTLVLKTPKRDIVDKVGWGEDAQDYETAPATNPPPDKSIGRIGGDTDNNQENFKVQNPTPGAENEIKDEEDKEEEEEEGEKEAGVGPRSVVINEIAWAGTKANPADEWIELYNNTTSSIDLTGWRLVSDDGGPDITFTTSSIPSGGYFLIERTDDNTVSDILADLTTSFGNGLSNKGENLELRNSQGNLIDSVNASSTGWFAGVGATSGPSYISMEKINSLLPGSDPGNWASNNRITKNGQDADGNLINGTPKAENSVSKSSTQLPNGLTIIEDLTLTYLGSPYLVEKSITVSGAKLTIEPGVIVKFKHTGGGNQNNLLKITNGDLEALGSGDKKIIFTSSSTEPEAGQWDGIYLENSSGTLINSIIQYGGMCHKAPEFPTYAYGLVRVDGGRLTIENSLIRESETLGIWIENSTSSIINQVQFKNINPACSGSWGKQAAIYVERGNPTIKDSDFENNEIGILVDYDNSPVIQNNTFVENDTPIKIIGLSSIISGNTAQNNDYDGIFLTSLGLKETITWSRTDLPYIAEDLTLYPGSTLNIEEGVVVKFLDGARFQVQGQLLANGKPNQQIIFTAHTNSWDYILFSVSSTGSVLDNVVVSYGGTWGTGPYWEKGAVRVEDASLTIKNSLFENNVVAGLELINSTTTINKTTFKDNRASYKSGMKYSKGLLLNNSTPTFNQASFDNNYYGIYVESGSCPDLSGAKFGEGADANDFDVYPESCSP